ncbi:hypothetical protein BD324DRAFT_679274 [Kockovaella imperatae]|uniref:Uncharacterized protein n=1 Tax=Kockovaella imperatae TaxID=4999 RepID=A0A1Y1URV3_9TREE|nr:hypothetical protein BD324DRAFT_679274 [Kockovaella imperatae]ORX40244.1 hypothetical protein BD324DRAFT_679274 [Kockovaella imperatae]
MRAPLSSSLVVDFTAVLTVMLLRTQKLLYVLPRVLILPLCVTALFIYHVYEYRVELGRTHLRSPEATPYRTLNGSALPLSISNGSLPRIHLLMPMDHATAKKNKRFCRSIESAIVNGWEPIVYNWDKEDINFLHGKVHGLAKLLASPSHSEHMAEDDLIVMIDASDVWLQLSPTVMARRFLEYDSDVIASTQKSCWPNDKSSETCLRAPASLLPVGLYHDKDDESDLSIFSPNGIRPQYANSGSIIGRLHAMKTLYAELISVLDRDDFEFDGDQGAFNVLLSQGKIRLDYWSRLFWAADEDLDQVKFVNTRYPPDPTTSDDLVTPWALYPSLLHHTKTGEVPVAVHLNGPKKKRSRLEQWWGYHWWNSGRERFRNIVSERLGRGSVRIVKREGFKTISVRELCPMLDVWDWHPKLPLDGL